MKKYSLLLFAAIISFHVFAQQPVISSFSPSSGPIGTLVTISGSNFDAASANNAVFFGAVKAPVITASTNQLTVKVPVGETNQPITLSVNQLTAFASQPFNVSFQPGSPGFVPNPFLSKTDFISGQNPSDPVIADMDGDGKPDIIVVNANVVPNSLSIFRNTSTDGILSFDRTMLAMTNGYGLHFGVADINGDGRKDIVVANSQVQSIEVFINSSSAGFIGLNLPVTINTGIYPQAIALGDFDKDGKIDIVIASAQFPSLITSFRNTGNLNSVSFTIGSSYTAGDFTECIAVGDLDGDGQPEIVTPSPNGPYGALVFKNTSTNGAISFAAFKRLTTGAYPVAIAIGDLDGDKLNDIAVACSTYNKTCLLLNKSTLGNIAFAPRTDVDMTSTDNMKIAIRDLDGDGKADITIGSSYPARLIVLKNASTTGTLSFTRDLEFAIGRYAQNGIAIGDLDLDGKPDITVASLFDQTPQDDYISVFKNKVGDAINICPFNSPLLTTNLTGAGYQWQVNTGNQFNNVVDNSNYMGSQTTELRLINIPSSWTGYKYRCVVDGVNGSEFLLRIVNIWTGAANTSWENPSNWSCGTVPDQNTDVVINSGTVVLDSDITIRTLTVNPAANFTVNANHILTVTH